MFRYLRAVVAGLLILGLLAGCGAAPTQESKLSDKPVELVVYSAFGLNREALDAVIDLYETNYPNVKVKVKEIQANQFLGQSGQMNPALFEGGDLVILNSTMASLGLDAGMLRDLSSVRLPSFDPMVSGVIDDLTKVDGRRFSVPITVQPTMLLMNETAFKNAGLSAPPLDWTIQEFEQALSQLQATGASATRLTLAQVMEPMVRAYGGKIYDGQTQEWVFDTPEAQQGLAWLARLVQSGLLEQGGGQGMVVRMGGGPGGSRNLPALMPMAGGGIGGFTIAAQGTTYQPYPKGPRGRAVPVTGTVGVVLQSAANPEVATDFLREMVTNPAAQLALARSGVRPVIADSKAQAAWRESVGDRSADAIELSLNGAYVDSTPNRTEFLQGMAPYFEGTSTLEQIIPTLKAQLDS